MRTIKILAAIWCCIMTISACKKDHDEDGTPTVVNIAFSAPQAAQVYRNGDTMNIAATVTADGVMHGYELLVTDTATGEVLCNYAEHAHGDRFVVQQAVGLSGATARAMKVDIRVEVDHAGNEKEAYIVCRYQP
ncbi:hypothetical protein GCM10023093_27260 [Nemorincola caseinilytica]|uniref:DUF4625 domain-containing protein n=1 Tax=Nemorincola caseinilytica TaxID=2054315 RepID=A0ABP8NPR3_9BACT